MNLTLIVKYEIWLLIALLLCSSFTSAYEIVQNPVTPNNVNENVCGSKVQEVMQRINESLIREHLGKLVGFSPRYTATYGCEKSAEYIYNNFEDFGLNVRYQNWSAFGNRWHPGYFNSQNVEGEKPGTKDDKIILFNAHYDTVENTPGADDNGGGAAAVLAAAYALSQYDFKHTVRFVTFSGEEIGLLGSHAYAKEAYENQDDILVDFNADMIGNALTADGGSRFRVYGSQDVEWIMDEIEEINTDYGAGFNLTRSVLDETASRGGSDYFSFIEYGYEAITFFEYEWCEHMHTPEDTLDKVNFSYLVNTTRLIAGIMAYLADLEEFSYPHVEIEFPRRGNLYFQGVVKKEISDLQTTVIDDIWIWTDVEEGDAPIILAEFYYDDVLEFVDTEAPFKWHFNKFSLFREHKVTVKIYDQLGRSASSWMTIRFINIRTRES